VEIEKLRKTYDLTVDWKPFFLRPETPPEGMPLPAYIVEKIKDPNEPLKLRAAREGLKMIRGDRIPSTRRAHEAAEFARAHGKLEPLHAALLKRYWELGQDLYSMDVLRGAATDAGLDPDDLQAALESGTFKDAVEQGVQEARELGIRAVPTFVFNDSFGIQGAEEQPAFLEAMRRLGAKPVRNRH
jgi:predicted DsbA family dithiol-disulfide isomerase